MPQQRVPNPADPLALARAGAAAKTPLDSWPCRDFLGQEAKGGQASCTDTSHGTIPRQSQTFPTLKPPNHPRAAPAPCPSPFSPLRPAGRAAFLPSPPKPGWCSPLQTSYKTNS